MSAGLWDIEVPRVIDRKHVLSAVRQTSAERKRWNPGQYSAAQIRALARQVFLSGASPVVKQVVFSRIDCPTGVEDLVRRVAGILAESSSAEIAIVEEEEIAIGYQQTASPQDKSESGPLKRIAREVQPHVWLLPPQPTRFAALADYWSAIRREFEYSILLAECGAQSDQVTAMAEAADGIVLVLSARHTRRAAARRIKQRLDDARVRLLGTVLMDREFPIPEGIYRRL